MVDAIYSQHKKLEKVFQFFDPYDSGWISKDQFRVGCEKLNNYLRDGEKIQNCDAILDMMDLDETGSVSVNEFFEMFRIIDARMTKSRKLPNSSVDTAEAVDLSGITIVQTDSFSTQFPKIVLFSDSNSSTNSPHFGIL